MDVIFLVYAGNNNQNNVYHEDTKQLRWLTGFDKELTESASLHSLFSTNHSV